MDFRKGILAVIIAILFTLLVFTTVDAFYEPIEHNECYEKFEPRFNLSEQEEQQLQECNKAFDEKRDERQFIAFIVSSIAGLIAVVVGLSLSAKTSVGMTVSSGILLGGLFSLFFGTINNWSSIGYQLRPIVLVVILGIVIFVAYRKLSDFTPKSTPKKESRRASKKVAKKSSKRT